MSQTLIEVKNIEKHYRAKSNKLFAHDTVHAVDHVSFTVGEGEILGLVGESGCGKSTVGRMLVGLEKPDRGEILYRGGIISGADEKQLKGVRTKLQMVFQDGYSSLNPRKHIRDIMADPMLYHGIADKSDVDEKIDELLNMVGLPGDTKGRYPHEFSGGQRQRICIARALALQPEFIVCDEAVSALDVSIQAQILNLLGELSEKLNISMLFIAHGLAAVRYISDRVAVMYMGEIVEIATAEELFKHPLHPYTNALRIAAPAADPEKDSFGASLLQGEVGSNVNPPAGCRFHTRCPYAGEECAVERPALKEYGKGHMCACHFAGVNVC